MSKSESYCIWVETAYQLFAEEGPENFSIKALANRCRLPRTNFYYYFDNKEEIIEAILELHFQTTTEHFNIELEKKFNTLIPDLYEAIYEFKLGIQFARQLFRYRDKPQFNKAHKKGLTLSVDLILPKFKDYFEINLPDNKAKELWFTLADVWYSRINFDDYTVKSLSNLAIEIMSSITPLINMPIEDN
jgi:AcrR family transcriptional regulator